MFDRRPQEQQSQQLQEQATIITTQSRPSQLVAIGVQNSLPIVSEQSNANQNFNRPMNLAEPATTTARTPTITPSRIILRPVDGLDFSTNTVD